MKVGSIHNYECYYRRDWQNVSGDVIETDSGSVIIGKKILRGSKIGGESFLLGCYLTNGVSVGPGCIIRGTYIGPDSVILNSTSIESMFSGNDRSSIDLPIILGGRCRLNSCDFLLDGKEVACENIYWDEKTGRYKLGEDSRLKIGQVNDCRYKLCPKKI